MIDISSQDIIGFLDECKSWQGQIAVTRMRLTGVLAEDSETGVMAIVSFSTNTGNWISFNFLKLLPSSEISIKTDSSGNIQCR